MFLLFQNCCSLLRFDVLLDESLFCFQLCDLGFLVLDLEVPLQLLNLCIHRFLLLRCQLPTSTCTELAHTLIILRQWNRYLLNLAFLFWFLRELLTHSRIIQCSLIFLLLLDLALPVVGVIVFILVRFAGFLSLSNKLLLLRFKLFGLYLFRFYLTLKLLDPMLNRLVILLELRLPSVLLLQQRSLRVVRPLGHLPGSRRVRNVHTPSDLRYKLTNLGQSSLLNNRLLRHYRTRWSTHHFFALLGIRHLHLGLTLCSNLCQLIVALQVNRSSRRCLNFSSGLTLTLNLRSCGSLRLHLGSLLTCNLLRSLHLRGALRFKVVIRKTIHHHFTELSEGLVRSLLGQDNRRHRVHHLKLFSIFLVIRGNLRKH